MHIFISTELTIFLVGPEKCVNKVVDKRIPICCGSELEVINNSDSKVVFIALDLSGFDTQ